MKTLFFIFLFFIMTTIGVPVLLLGLMYEGSATESMPIELYTEDADGFNMLYAKLDEALQSVRSDDTADFVVSLHEDIINTLIFNAIRGDGPFEDAINAAYLPGADCETSLCAYIVEESFDQDGRQFIFRLVGVWVAFDEDLLVAHVAVEASYNDNITYRTIVKFDVSLLDDIQEQEYYLAYERARVGRLPFPKQLLTTVFSLLNRVTTIDTDEDSNHQLESFMTFNRQALSLRIDKPGLVESLRENNADDVGSLLGAEVLELVFTHGLLNFKFTEERLDLRARISLIRVPDESTIPSYLETQRDDAGFIPDAFDPEAHLKDRFEAFIFNMALSGSQSLTLYEDSFNQMIYHAAAGFEGIQYEFDYQDSANQTEIIWVGLEAVWLQLKAASLDDSQPANLMIYGLFNIGGIKSRLAIRADALPDQPLGAIAFDITTITLGQAADKAYLNVDNLAPFKQLLQELDDYDFLHINAQNHIVFNLEGLTNFVDTGTTAGALNVTHITLVEGGLKLDIEASDATLQALLEDFTEAVQQIFETDLAAALDTALAPEADSPESATLAQVEVLQTMLTEGDTPTPDDVSTLVDLYSAMPPASQETFIETLESLIDPTLLDQFRAQFQE